MTRAVVGQVRRWTQVTARCFIMLSILVVSACVAAPGAPAGAPTASAGAGQPVPAAPRRSDLTPALLTATPVDAAEPFTTAEFLALAWAGDPGSIIYPSLGEMRGGSDAVIVGRINGLRRGPDDADQYGNVIYRVTATVAIERVLSGQPSERGPGLIEFRWAIGVGLPSDLSGDFASPYARFAARTPPERLVLFLASERNFMRRLGLPPEVGAADDGYRLVSFQGFFYEAADGTADRPATGTWLDVLRGRAFGSVADTIAAGAIP